VKFARKPKASDTLGPMVSTTFVGMQQANGFPWPRPPGVSDMPQWTGHGFQMGRTVSGVLPFIGKESGWSDELTEFHEVESDSGRHPIDVASRKRAIDVLRRRLPSASATILEIGCSSGYFLRDVREAFPEAFAIGADYVRGPLDRLAQSMPDLPLLQFDLNACPLPDRCIDAVVALNVLEHIPDDAAAIRQIHRILKPGGIAVIEVPAGPRLFDVYDKMLMHYRRYTRRQAIDSFRAAGFRVEDPSHLGFFLYPAFAIVKLRNRRYLREPEEKQRAIVAKTIRQTKRSAVMRVVMDLEALAARYVRYPVGIRCVLTAIKA
jgi:SAM-dependent methyltransferase